MYRAGLPVVASVNTLGSVMSLNTARNAVARNSVFLLWALRQGCQRFLDKNVVRLIVKQVFARGLAELTA